MSENNKISENSTKKTNSLREDVMERIASQKVEPRPRWYFTVKNLLLWLSGVILLLVGALSVSIIIFTVTGAPWEVRRVLGESPLMHLLHIFPFLWLFAFIAFLAISDYCICQTKGTYKHSSFKVSMAIILASIILGIIFNICKVSSLADNKLGKHTPKIYKTLEQRRHGILHHPEKGRVMGVVQSIDGRTFVVMDKNKKNELVINGEGIPEDRYELVEVGRKLLIIGKPHSKEVFNALDVHYPEKKMRKVIRTNRR